MVADRSIVTRFRVEYNQAVQGLNAVSAAAEKTASTTDRAGQSLENASRRQADAAGKLRVAEAQLTDAKRNNEAGSAKVIAAEEKVARARREVDTATQAATRATNEYARAATKTGQQSSSTFAQLKQHARDNEQAWNSAGVALSTFGGTLAAVGGIALKTGIDYNTLQQQSRKALTTLTGSAEQANAQMDKLDEFARNSPFSKGVFIKAQQQMLGFGIEAKKVVPYMDAIQNAVAAAGGSNHDIAELTRIMSQISASAKITATDLREFGNRGIDAATLIGSQMGKTGAQIRDDITAGTLDANDALDALANGMATRFDGAAEGVKTTFVGALDRVKAAWRDLSSTMAQPLVGSESGGLAIGGLNMFADRLRDVGRAAEALPEPVRLGALALGGLMSAASLAVGGFLLMLPRINETREAFKALSSAPGGIGATVRGLERMAPALRNIAQAGGAVAVISGLTFGLAKLVEGNYLERVAIDAQAVEKALSGVGTTSISDLFRVDGGNLTGEVNDLGTALERTFDRNPGEKFNDWAEHWINAATGMEGSSQILSDRWAMMDEQLASMVANGNTVGAARQFEQIRLEAEQLDIPMSRLAILFPDYTAAAEEAGIGSASAAEGIFTMSEAAVEAQAFLSETKNVLLEAGQGFFDFAAAATDSEVSLRQWIKTLEEQVEAQNTWHENLSTLVDRGAPVELMEQLMELGPEGAFRVKQLADASDEELQRVIDAFQQGEGAVDSWVAKTFDLPPIDLDADPSKLEDQIANAETKLDELEAKESSPVVDAQIELLKEKIREAELKLEELDKAEANPTIRPKIDQSAVDNMRDIMNGMNSGKGYGSGVPYKTWNQYHEDKRRSNVPGPAGRATGGGITGPGTGTSDDILIRASNGEHMWTAAEVRAMGGQANVYRLRHMARSGDLRKALPGFALGGAVSSAESRLTSAQRDLDQLRRSKRDLTPEQARQEEREAAAQRRIDRAREDLDRAKAEQARRDRVKSLQVEASTDIRRGQIRDQVTGSLSGGYSAVDRLMRLADDDNLSGGSRRRARTSAGRFEADLRRLYGQAESLDERLKDAKEKARELEGIQNSVSSSVSRRAYTLDTSSHWAQSKSGVWEQTVGVSGARTNAAFAAGRVKSLAQKLNKLQGMGYGGAILQEVAQAGSIEDSILMADALLQGSESDVTSLNASYADIEKYSKQAGQYVTAGFFDGGVNAAQGIVKGIESEQKTVERKIADLAKAMESTLKSVLGIRSPSTVMAEIGHDTAEGLRVGLLDSVSSVADASSTLASALVPTDLTMPVVSGDLTPANAAVGDMSGVTLAALSEMSLAVSEGYAAMNASTQESLTSRSAITETELTGQTQMTSDHQTMMRDITALRQGEMLEGTRVAFGTMREAVRLEQDAMRVSTADLQMQTLVNMKAQQAAMLESTRVNYRSIRESATNETNVLRANVSATLGALRTDHEGHLSSMREVNAQGFNEMRAAGIAAFQGLRSGIGGQMVQAQPELIANLNRLIDEFGRFTASVNEAFGDVGVKLSAPTRLAQGGVMPGYTPGRDVHHFRSPTAGDLYLSGGEAIMRPEFTQAVGGEAGVRELNALARRGRIGDMNSALHTVMYANGGVLPPIPGVTAFADSGVWRSLFGAVKERFPDVRLHSAYRPGSITATGNRSMHGRGMAVDITPRMDIANWIRENYGGGTRELIFSPMGNRQIHRGRNHYYTGVTRRMHFDHIHWAMERMLEGVMPFTGDGYGGGALPPAHPFLDKAGISAGTDLKKSYRAAAQKLFADIMKKQMPALSGMNPLMASLGEGVMRSMQDGLIEKAVKHGESQSFVMPGGEGVERWRNTVIQALQRAGLPQTDDYVNAWLRQIKSESGGNPNIRQQIRDVNSGGNEAMGLVQVIPGTFAAFRDKSLPNDRTHPLANLVAGMNWAKYKARRQGRSMLSFIGHGHGYTGGSHGAASGPVLVGENGPEIVEMRGGERIHANPQTERFLSIQARPQASVGLDYDQLARAITNAMPVADLAGALDGVPITLTVDGQQMSAHITTTLNQNVSRARSDIRQSSKMIGAKR